MIPLSLSSPPPQHFALHADFVFYYYSGTDAAVSSKKPVDHSVATGEESWGCGQLKVPQVSGPQGLTRGEELGGLTEALSSSSDVLAPFLGECTSITDRTVNEVQLSCVPIKSDSEISR